MASLDKLDELLRRLLCGGWTTETERAILGLGPPALERLLDASDGVFFPTDQEWRDYGVYRRHAVAAFAKVDMDGVLEAMKKRNWTNAAIACSGVGLVRDVRVVPILISCYGEREPLLRRKAVEFLGHQSDARALSTVIRALRDRSSDVRLAAIRACAEIGDAQAIDHLREFERRHQKSPLIEREVRLAIRKIRNG